jgi:hypothetical protein
MTFNPQKCKTKGSENVVTQILIEFDPTQASPLEVINSLTEMMQKHFEEKNVKEFQVSLIHVNESDVIDFVEILQIQPPPTIEPPKQETPK